MALGRSKPPEPPADLDFEPEPDSPYDPQILAWREGWLKGLGFSELAAQLLSTAPVDRPEVERLLARGCTQEQALRILL